MEEKYYLTNKEMNGMKITIIPVFIAASTLLLCPTTNVLAQTQFEGALKSVSITSTVVANTPPTASFTYSHDGDVLNFDASAASDADGSITEYKWNFGDGNTGTGVTVSHSFSGDISVPVTLTVMDNLGAVTINQEIVSLTAAQPAINVSFQPAEAPIQSGFVADSGAAFNSSQSYGWILLPTNTQLYDYNHASSPDQAYDTVMIMPTADGIWELAVQNGSYSVTICLGDPSYPQGAAYAQAEGVQIIAGTLSTSSPWIENTEDVTVSDGKLTVTFIGSGAKRRLSWLKVSPN